MIPYLLGVGTGLACGGLVSLVVMAACAEAMEMERAEHEKELQAMADAMVDAGRLDAEGGRLDWHSIQMPGGRA